MAKMIQFMSESGEKQYPATSSEAVGMSDGSGNLDAKLAELEEKFESNNNLSYKYNLTLNKSIDTYNGSIVDWNGRAIVDYLFSIESSPSLSIDSEDILIGSRYYDENNIFLGSSYTSKSKYVKIILVLKSANNSQLSLPSVASDFSCTFNINEDFYKVKNGMLEVPIGIDDKLSEKSKNLVTNKAVSEGIKEFRDQIELLYNDGEGEGEDISQSVSFFDGIYVQADDSNESIKIGNTGVSSGSSTTDYINIDGYDIIDISVFKSSNKTSTGCVLYDENKNAVIGYTFPYKDTTGIFQFKINNLYGKYKYIRTTIRKIDKENFKCILKQSDGLVPQLRERINEIKDDSYNFFKKQIKNITYKDNLGLVVSDNYIGNESTSSIIKTTDYIYCKNSKKITIDNILYAEETGFGVVFYDDNKKPVKGFKFGVSNDGEYKIIKEDFVSVGYSYFRCSALMNKDYDQEISIFFNDAQSFIDSDVKLKGKDIYIAACDSNSYDKSIADFICDGINDEEELSKASKLVKGNSTIHLAEGNYYIDSFLDPGDGTPNYVFLTPYSNGRSNINIICDKNKNLKTSSTSNDADDISVGAVIRITDKCYNNLKEDVTYSIIRCCSDGGNRPYSNTLLTVNGIGFKIPDNEKPIICIDGYFASAIDARNCQFNAIKSSRDLHLPNVNLIGIRGVQGSNYGIFNYVMSCAAWGMGQGFALAGEHLYVEQCVTRFCRYGYNFNNFLTKNGIYVHGIIMINCADEFGFNMPLFGENKNKQPIYIIGLNFEWDSEYYGKFEGQGKLMTESTPGSWYGSLSYTITGNHSGWINTTDEPVWASDGSGCNIKSVNDAQKIKCDTYTRQRYAPNIGQIIFDESLNKPVICIDNINKKWIDFNGNEV